MSQQVNSSVSQLVQLPAPDRDRSLRVVRKVKSAVDIKMAYLFDGLTINAADALFEEVYEEREENLLERQFNITRALKTEAVLYQEEFTTLMNLSWVNLVKNKDEQGLAEPEGELRAVLNTSSERKINQFKVLIEELRLRFNGLIGQEMTFHPLLPGNFYLCFWYATEKLNLSHEERLMLLPLFNRFVMDRFGQVLSAANQCLVSLEVGYSNG